MAVIRTGVSDIVDSDTCYGQNIGLSEYINCQIDQIKTKWHEPSKQQESQPVEKHRVNSWQPRLSARHSQQQEVSRSHIDTDQEQWLCVKSVATRNPPSCSFASCLSSVLFVKSPRTSRLTCVSNLQLSVRFKKPLRHISSVSLKTPISLPSTPNVSPSSQKTFNWLVASEESVLK